MEIFFEKSKGQAVLKIEDLRPIPAPRPRVTKWGTYNDPKYTYYKKLIQQAMGNKFYSDKPLTMSLVFSYTYPRSWAKKRCVAQPHASRPDLDNLCKGIMDALNEVCYKDDSQIVHLSASKIYSDVDTIQITLREIEL